MKKFLKILIMVLGGIVLLNAVAVSFIQNPNTGIFMTYALGLFLVFLGVFFDKLLEKLPKWLKISFFSAVGVAVVFVCVLFIYGNCDNVTYTEDAVIVLGAGIRGETPSRTLAERLDVAIEYHKKNPDAVIVVSGGQGYNEDITEALAMERYLLAAGVAADKIIKEERSTSTAENFRYSKELLDEHFDREYSLAFITNDFHIMRGALSASRCGYDATHAHSPTDFYTILPNTLRECLAFVKYLVFP
jgi:uncharacterized SAM-binding protein YcdF (DUF218 family)